MIKGISHVAFTVENMKKSLEFYCNILGFKKVFDLKKNNGEPWIVYLKAGDSQFVELFYGGREKSKWSDETIGYSHLCLETDDIMEIANRLKSGGLKLDAEPKQGSDLNWQCWVRDPDGNRIEIMQISPESPQIKALNEI